MEPSRVIRAAAIAAMLAGAGLSPAAWIGAAQAQSLPSPFIADQAALFRSDVAGMRQPPDANDEGTRLGSLRLRASLDAAIAYDSNFLNTPVAADLDVPLPDASDLSLAYLLDPDGLRRGDALVQLTPRVSLASDWARHALQVNASGQIDRFFANAALGNYETWDVGARARFDIGPESEIALDGAIASDVEARGVSGLFFTAGEPIAFRDVRAGVGFATRRGPWALRLSGGWLQRRYDDFQLLTVIPIPLDFRDVEQWSVTANLGHRLRPGLDLFVRGNASFSRGLASDARLVQTGAVRRDAEGYAVSGGIRGELTPLLLAEIAAGWQRRSFSDLRLADYDGFTYDARLDWFPTPLISLRLRTLQEFENSGLSNVPGILLRDTNATVFYELTRALQVQAGVSWQYRQYRGAFIATDSYDLQARAEYRLNRRLSAGLFVRHRRRTSNDDLVLAPYDGTIVGVAISTRL